MRAPLGEPEWGAETASRPPVDPEVGKNEQLPLRRERWVPMRSGGGLSEKSEAVKEPPG